MLSEVKKTGAENDIGTLDTALDHIPISKTHILDGFITREQLAAEFGKSLRTIDRWEVRRIGPPRIIVGRTILYRVEAVRAWLQSCERVPGLKRNGRRLYKTTR